MGEGQDKVAQSLLDLQPTAILDLFLLYPDAQKKPSEYYPIHNGSIFKKGVVWQGVTYMPIGMEIDGFEVNADGRVNRPKIRISNKDYYVTNLLRKNEDFKNGKVVRKRTFVKFLDDENFDGGNPFGESNDTAELSSQEYIIAQKVQENKIIVELELTSPLDLDNFEINHRRIMGKYCYWQYRGNGCQYRGLPIHREDGKDFKDINGDLLTFNGDFVYGLQSQEYNDKTSYKKGDLAFIRNDRVDIVDPYGLIPPLPILNYYIAKTDVKGLRPDQNPKYWEKDGCNKKLSSCKLRFTEDKQFKKFVGAKQVETGISSLSGYNRGNDPSLDYWFEPENVPKMTAALSGDSWTYMIIFKAYKDKAQNAGYLSSNNNKYEGINIYEYDRRVSAYYRTTTDSSKTLKSPNKFTEEQPRTENLPWIMRKESENKATITEYSNDANTSATYSDTITGTHTGFVLCRSRGSIDHRSPDVDIEGFFFWNRSLSNDELDLLFRELPDGGHRIRNYSEFVSGNSEEQNLVNSSLLGWWTFPFDDGSQKGILNQKDEDNNLIYYGDDQDFLKEDTYIFNLEQLVDTQETVSYLPFGGFPGTDGFDFSRDV